MQPVAEKEIRTGKIGGRTLAAGLLAGAIAVLAAVEPLAAIGAALGLCFVVLYVYRRDALIGAVFLFLLAQNLVYIRLLPVNGKAAWLVKQGDDFLTIFFAAAIVIEKTFPRLAVESLPLWRGLAAIGAVCLVSAAYNHLSLKETAVGSYVLLKSFVWFYLAATVKLDGRGFRRLTRFAFLVFGAILAFAFFQLATGELTYNWLGLPRDYRFGILRLRSFFVHPVFLGETMAFLAILSVSAYIHLRNPLYLGLAAAALAAVGLSMMVKTVLALGVVLGFLLLRKRPFLVVPYVLAAVFSMIAFGEYGKENVRQQFRIYIESPQSVRREGYRICGEILRDSPLLGVGPGMFGGYAATVLQSPVPVRYGFINYDQQEYTTIDAHWPHLAAEIGLLGLLVYCWWLWAAGRASWGVSNTAASPYARLLGLTAAVFLLVIVIEAFAAENIEDTLCGFIVFSALGFTQRAREKSESAES